MKIKILTDTSCGLSRNEAEQLGYEIIALPFILDEKEYDEDKLTNEEFYNELDKSNDIHTSQAPVEKVTSAFDKLLNENDMILYLPITSGLSSSYENALNIVEDEKYKNKVVVIDHKAISVVQRGMLSDVKKLVDSGVDPYRIKQLVEENAKYNRVYITVDTLDYLKKGGRVSALTAMAGNLLNIKPILFSNGNKFEVVKKVRGLKLAEEEMKQLVKNDLDTLLNGVPMEKISMGVAYTGCLDEAEKYKQSVEESFGTKVYFDELSKVIGCHIGKGAVALAVYKHIDEC